MSAPVGPKIQKDRSVWTDLPASSPDTYMTQVYPICPCEEHAPAGSTEAGVLDVGRQGQLCSVRLANGLSTGSQEAEG